MGVTAARLFSFIDGIGPQRYVFASEFPHEIAMEDALREIIEILGRRDINDKHKAMILGENAKRFYNSGVGFSLLH